MATPSVRALRRGRLGITVPAILIATLVGVAIAQPSLAEPASAIAQLVADEDAATALLARLGAWAYVAAPLLMVIVAILPIPAEVPAIVNGMVFGAIIGTILTWVGAIIGAMISFELARRWGRPLAERIVNPRIIARADRLVESAGWPGLVILRLIPTVAFTAINWGAGLTSLGRGTFFWTTALGILPGALVFTSSGTGLAALYRMNPAVAWGLGLATLGVMWWTIARFRMRGGAEVAGTGRG